MGGSSGSQKAAERAAQLAQQREQELEDEEKQKNANLMSQEVQSMRRSRFSGGSLFDQITGKGSLG